jgi:hypothetical protein
MSGAMPFSKRACKWDGLRFAEGPAPRSLTQAPMLHFSEVSSASLKYKHNQDENEYENDGCHKNVD